jgi:hypothetical protein
MVNVTARKIREHGRDAKEKASGCLSRVYHGLLVSYPMVGRGMVIFRDPNGHRMVTTPVRRILTDPGQRLGVRGNRKQRLPPHLPRRPPPSPPPVSPVPQGWSSSSGVVSSAGGSRLARAKRGVVLEQGLAQQL